MNKVVLLKMQIREKLGYGPLALIVATAVMFSAYMWQLNIATTAGYQARALEENITALNESLSRGETKLADLQSINSVTTRMDLLGLTKVNQVSYVFTNSGTVALR